MRTEDRFRELDRIPVPDQWEDIRDRRPRAERPDDSVRSRMATTVIALAIAAGGIALAAVAFLGGPESRPAAPSSPMPSTTPTRPANTTPSPDIEANHSDPWGAPTALSVTCTRDGIELLSTEVPAQPDGVHVVVDNSGGATHLLSDTKGPRPVPEDRTSRFDLFDPHPDGYTRTVANWPPGPVEIACEFPGLDQRSATVRVTDPNALWISDALACEETVPYNRETVIGNADIVKAVRENVRGVLPTDDIVRAGYPQDPFPAAYMLVVRDGDPVAVLILPYHGSEGGWHPFVGEICVGSGIMGA
jgi:hypothetical protein